MLITHTKLSNAWGGKWKRKPYDKHLNYLISVHKSTHTRTSFKYISLQWTIKILCKFWLNRAKRNQGLQIRRSASKKKGYIEIFRMPSTFANFFCAPMKSFIMKGSNKWGVWLACVCMHRSQEDAFMEPTQLQPEPTIFITLAIRPTRAELIKFYHLFFLSVKKLHENEFSILILPRHQVPITVAFLRPTP